MTAGQQTACGMRSNEAGSTRDEKSHRVCHRLISLATHRQVSPVEDEDLAGRKRRLVACQVGCEPGNVGRSSHAAHGNVCDHAATDLIAGNVASRKWSVEMSGRDAIYGNAVSGQFDGHGPSELTNPALGDRVDRGHGER